MSVRREAANVLPIIAGIRDQCSALVFGGVSGFLSRVVCDAHPSGFFETVNSRTAGGGGGGGGGRGGNAGVHAAVYDDGADGHRDRHCGAGGALGPHTRRLVGGERQEARRVGGAGRGEGGGGGGGEGGTAMKKLRIVRLGFDT